MKTSEDIITYGERVMALTLDLNKAITSAKEEQSVVLNSLVTLVALLAKDTEIPRDEFCSIVAGQLYSLIDTLNTQDLTTH